MEPPSTQPVPTSQPSPTSDVDAASNRQPGEEEANARVVKAPSTSQGVPAAEVQRLYRQFRQATIESTARELQKQGQAHADVADIARPSVDLNRFDPILSTITQVEFLGLRFHRMPQEKAVETLLALAKSDRTYRVYFANAHSIEVASRQPELAQALKRSSLLLADGSGVLLGSRLAGKSLVHNLNGTDLIPALCQAASPQRPLSVYFLGAKPAIAQQAADNLARRYAGLRIAGVRDGYFSEAELPRVLQSIREAQPDVLLVAMGTPLQEIWIDRHASQLPGIVCIAVGGLFDFMAEQVVRAPKIFRVLGIEWIWRLMMEPTRLWKRYTVGNLIYLKVLVTAWLQEKRRQPRQAEPTNLEI